MMKKILITLTILFLIAVGLGILAVSNASLIINQYKPQLEELVSDALGTKTKIGSVSATFFPETKITIDELSLGSKEKGEALSLKNISLKVSPMPLLNKQVVIEEFSIADPNITITKDADGVHLPGVHLAQANPPVAHSGVDNKKKPEALPISLSLKSCSIKNGTFTFIDRTQQKEITASNISIKTSVSLDGGSLNFQSLSMDSFLESHTPFKVTIPDMHFNLLNKETTAPALALTLGGNNITIKSLSMNQAGVTTYALSGDALEADVFTGILKQMHYAPESLNVKGRFSIASEGVLASTGLDSKKLELEAFGGKISAPSRILFDDKHNFSSKLSLASIHIDKTMEFLSPGVKSKLFGTIINSSGSLSGQFGPTLKEGLSGDFSFSIKDGGIRGVNIAGKALKNIDKIPFLNGSLFSHVPQQFQATLESEDTEFSTLTGAFSIQNGSIMLKGVKMANKIYSIDADGSVGFDSTMNVNATISFNRDFSLALVSVAHDFKKILTPQETLVFPLTIKGTLPGVLVIPNFSKVLELAGEKLLTEKATDALGKILQGKGGKGLGSLFKF